MNIDNSAALPRPRVLSGDQTIAARKHNKPFFFLGIFCCALLITHYFIPVQWQTLMELQSNDLYKQLSGFTMLAFVLLQWRLAHLKTMQRIIAARSNLKTHQWIGALAPLLIFLHSMQTGHAHQTALLYLFIAAIITGLLSFHTIKIRKQWFIVGWTIVHITLATAVLALMAFHIYVVYWYS